jgi:hypothetical protein
MSKTFVYLCRPGKNEELRYSLRSVTKFYPEATVWVVGGKPDWYTGNFIEIPQNLDRFKNIKNSLASIIDNKNIPDKVIIMNDDFFFVRHVENIRFYVSGTLKDRIDFNRENGVASSYIRQLRDLQKHCKKFRNPPLDFDIHVPMPINKKNLSEVVGESVMWRSNYGNRFVKDSEIEIMNDVKVYSESQYAFKSYDYTKLKEPFLSTHDTSFQKVYANLLKDMFPNPSKYESSGDNS